MDLSDWHKGSLHRKLHGFFHPYTIVTGQYLTIQRGICLQYKFPGEIGIPQYWSSTECLLQCIKCLLMFCHPFKRFHLRFLWNILIPFIPCFLFGFIGSLTD